MLNIPALIDEEGNETPIIQIEIDQLLQAINEGSTEPEDVVHTPTIPDA